MRGGLLIEVHGRGRFETCPYVRLSAHTGWGGRDAWWIPAFAGMTNEGAGMTICEIPTLIKPPYRGTGQALRAYRGGYSDFSPSPPYQVRGRLQPSPQGEGVCWVGAQSGVVHGRGGFETCPYVRLSAHTGWGGRDAWWIPAFAGMTKEGAGMTICEIPTLIKPPYRGTGQALRAYRGGYSDFSPSPQPSP